MLLKRLRYRFNQFITAFRANISYSDVEFIRHYLTKAEQVLFYKMRRYDQKHALQVAHKCLLKCDSNTWIDRSNLVRVALLHDIGKSIMPLSLISRILYVLTKKINEGRLVKFFAKEKSFIPLFRQFYVLNNHSDIGAELIGEIENNPELIEIIRNHHNKPTPNESQLLPVIREIDRIS